jgi:hypothetical protein
MIIGNARTSTIEQVSGFESQIIPFPRNKITFERVKAPRLSDRKRVHIKSIWTRLRSLKRGALTRSNVILFLGNESHISEIFRLSLNF